MNQLAGIWRHPEQMPAFTLPEWEDVLGQAMHSRLAARLALHFQDHGWLDLVPDGPRQYLEGSIRLADRQQHEAHWEIDCIRRALVGVDCPIVFLKGAAYLLGGLPAGRGRIFSDIDIMVERDHLVDVEVALFKSGWLSEERDPYNEKYYRQWMHEIPPMKHVQRNTMIDVHHTITPPTSCFAVDGSKLLTRIVPVFNEPNLYILAPCDMVLHSAVHLFQEGEFSHGLRDLLDLNDLLNDFCKDAAFWPELLDRAEDIGLQRPLFHALFHLRDLVGMTPPAQWMDRIDQFGPSKPARTAMAWLLSLALEPDHPSCNTQWTAVARWLLYVRSHALRMPLHLAIPHLVRKAWMRNFPEKKEIGIAKNL